MDRTNALNLCEEYLHQVWCIESMKDGVQLFCMFDRKRLLRKSFSLDCE